MVGVTVELHFTDKEQETRFIRSYLHGAWERFEASDFWEHGWFWSHGQFSEYDIGVKDGRVLLVFDGDPDGLVESEADRWESFDGLDRWTVRRYDDPDAWKHQRSNARGEQPTYESLLAQQQAQKGAIGGQWEYQYKALTSRLALAYRHEFESCLPPDPSPTEDNPAGVGFWSLLHALVVQCGYDMYEENDACLRAIQARLKSIATYLGAEAARDEYDRIVAALDAFEADLDAWIADHETGTREL